MLCIGVHAPFWINLCISDGFTWFCAFKGSSAYFCEWAQFHRCVFSSSNTILYCCRYIKVLEIKRPVPFAKLFLMFSGFVYKFEISLNYVYNNSAEPLMGTVLNLWIHGRADILRFPIRNMFNTFHSFTLGFQHSWCFQQSYRYALHVLRSWKWFCICKFGEHMSFSYR